MELLIVLAVLSGLVMAGMSSLSFSYRKNQLELKANELSDAIHFSRSQAILCNKTLALTPLPNVSDWSKGMMLFIDNPEHSPHVESEVIHVWQWPSSNLTIHWKGFHSNRYLLFTADIRKSATNGLFTIQTGREKYQLKVNRLGRVKIIGASRIPIVGSEKNFEP